MPVEPSDLTELVECVSQALCGARSDRDAAALVERTCVTGSLGRGTYLAGREATGLVMFLNIDLQFSPCDAPEALDALAAALLSGLACDGWSFHLRVADAECRGGLWATLRCRPRGSGEASARDDVTLQLFLAENMTSTVTGQAEAEAREGPATSSAAGGTGDTAGAPSGAAGEVLLRLRSVDAEAARQQQQNLVAAAEQRARHEARQHHARNGGAVGAAPPPTAWAAKLAYGVAEARCIFWSSQPEAALRAARAAHASWSLAVETEKEQGLGVAAASGGDDGGKEASGGGDGGPGSELWSDEVMYLLDVLALHAYQEAVGQAAPAAGNERPTGQLPATAQDGAAAAADGPLVSNLFGVLSYDYASRASGLRVEIQGGLLVAPGGTEDARAGTPEEAGEVVGEAARRLVVFDPCFPVLDLYAAACEVVGQGEGAGVGQRRLQRLAAAAAAAKC